MNDLTNNGIALKDLKVGHLYLCRVSGRKAMVLTSTRQVDDRYSVTCLVYNPVDGRVQSDIVSDEQLMDLPSKPAARGPQPGAATR